MRDIVYSQQEVNETLSDTIDTRCPEFEKFVNEFNYKNNLTNIKQNAYCVNNISTNVDRNTHLVTYIVDY